MALGSPVDETAYAHRAERAANERPAPSDRLYFLGLEGDSTEVSPPPRTGRVLIGRDAAATLVMKDLSVSCEHAQVTRDRPRELSLLANAFLAQACDAHDHPPLHLSAAAMTALGAHAWPSNVR